MHGPGSPVPPHRRGHLLDCWLGDERVAHRSARSAPAGSARVAHSRSCHSSAARQAPPRGRDRCRRRPCTLWWKRMTPGSACTAGNCFPPAGRLVNSPPRWHVNPPAGRGHVIADWEQPVTGPPRASPPVTADIYAWTGSLLGHIQGTVTAAVLRCQRQPRHGPDRPIRAQHRISQVGQLMGTGAQAGMEIQPEPRQHASGPAPASSGQLSITPSLVIFVL